MLLYVSVGVVVVVSNFFFAIVLFQKTANELYLGGSYGSLGFAQKMYLNTFLVLETTAFTTLVILSILVGIHINFKHNSCTHVHKNGWSLNVQILKHLYATFVLHS